MRSWHCSREEWWVERVFLCEDILNTLPPPLAGLGLAQETLELRENYLPLSGVKGVQCPHPHTPLFERKMTCYIARLT